MTNGLKIVIKLITSKLFNTFVASQLTNRKEGGGGPEGNILNWVGVEFKSHTIKFILVSFQ